MAGMVGAVHKRGAYHTIYIVMKPLWLLNYPEVGPGEFAIIGQIESMSKIAKYRGSLKGFGGKRRILQLLIFGNTIYISYPFSPVQLIFSEGFIHQIYPFVAVFVSSPEKKRFSGLGRPRCSLNVVPT